LTAYKVSRLYTATDHVTSQQEILSRIRPGHLETVAFVWGEIEGPCHLPPEFRWVKVCSTFHALECILNLECSNFKLYSVCTTFKAAFRNAYLVYRYLETIISETLWETGPQRQFELCPSPTPHLSWIPLSNGNKRQCLETRVINQGRSMSHSSYSTSLY